ncbi:unnamed protein product [Pleuronectes platessa]|uniref:Uncharacterized protein n=1 Tax=Pleuronectes platessa TaxID=8262 RepID=A0A9N7VRD4_PLEPL|nr:unnamed protein product [Pleuronectes platessa]
MRDCSKQQQPSLSTIHHCSTTIYPRSGVVSTKHWEGTTQGKKMSPNCGCGGGDVTQQPCCNTAPCWCRTLEIQVDGKMQSKHEFSHHPWALDGPFTSCQLSRIDEEQKGGIQARVARPEELL